MKNIKQTYLIDAPLEGVWKALVDTETINAWGGGPAHMEDKEGFSFKLWGGEIHGKNLVVDPGKKLVQNWVGGKWETASKVTIDLNDENGSTRIVLLHENVPDDEYRDFEEGWGTIYFGQIKNYLENRRDSNDPAINSNI